MPSLNQNSQRNVKPSQNTGADTKKTANPIASRSSMVRCLTAEITPMGSPSASHTKADPSTSVVVITNLGPSSESTAVRVTNENPKPGQPYLSPKKTRLTKSRYWIITGLFRPNSCLTSLIVASVGCLPANKMAGFTGDMRKKIT